MEMTLHRALAQRKTTKARITQDFTKASFIDVTIGTSGFVSGVSVAEVKKNIQGNYDKIVALIDNFDRLNMAITRANAGVKKGTDVQTVKLENLDNREVTLADIIQLKESLKFRKNLVAIMSVQFSAATASIAKEQSRVDSRCDTMITGMKNGNENATISKADLDSIMKSFHENNDYKLVDPLNLQSLIEKLRDKNNQLEIEIDSKNSELNALTTIEIDI